MSLFTFSVCEECADFYYGDCPVHGSLRPYSDSTVSSSDTKKSIASLPNGMEIKESSIESAGLGVFATETFTVGATFGPYAGEKVRADIPKANMDTSYMWEVIILFVLCDMIFYKMRQMVCHRLNIFIIAAIFLCLLLTL